MTVSNPKSRSQRARRDRSLLTKNRSFKHKVIEDKGSQRLELRSMMRRKRLTKAIRVAAT